MSIGMMEKQQLDIRKIKPERMRQISEKNTTVRLDEYLMSLPKDVIGKIMADQNSVQALMDRLRQTLDGEILDVYGGFMADELISYVSVISAGGDSSARSGIFAGSGPELQIEVLPAFQGRGVGFELLTRVVELVFSSLNVPHLYYVVIPSNTSSIALVEKLGGILESPKSYAEEVLLRTYRIERKK